MKQRMRPLLLMALLCCQAAYAALSPEAFTKEYATALRAALPAYKVEIVKNLEVRVADAKGGESTAYLDNAYNDYLANPDARQELIEYRVAAFAESLAADSKPLDPKNIVPIIKDHSWLDVANKKFHEQFNEQLIVVYAEDSPRSLRYFDVGDLEKAGVERGKLRALAIENLRRILPKIERHDGELYSMLTAGGNFEASLLLLDDLWQDGSIKVDGDIVVAVPARDLLLVTGSRNAAGVTRLREIAEEIVSQGTYTLTGNLFVYRNGKFQQF